METASSSPLTAVIDRRLTFLLFVLPVSVLLLSVLAINGGTLIYTLDDPYIHIDLARQIFAGHYGINPGEFSAPSSSVLWPFILAPFTPLGPVQLWLPLVLNVLFSFLTFSLLSQRLQDAGVCTGQPTGPVLLRLCFRAGTKKPRSSMRSGAWVFLLQVTVRMSATTLWSPESPPTSSRSRP